MVEKLKLGDEFVRVWEWLPGIWILYCKHCKTRKVWKILGDGARWQSMHLDIEYHKNAECFFRRG